MAPPRRLLDVARRVVARHPPPVSWFAIRGDPQRYEHDVVCWSSGREGGVVADELTGSDCDRCLAMLERAGFVTAERVRVMPDAPGPVIYVEIAQPPTGRVWVQPHPHHELAFSTGRPGDDTGQVGDEFMRRIWCGVATYLAVEHRLPPRAFELQRGRQRRRRYE